MHSAPTSPGRRALAVILAIIGVLHKGHHLVRAAVSFVVGAAFLAGAWFVARRG